MAVCVPERLPDHASIGEKRIFEFLRDHLAADCIVYYEANISRRYPDFIVLDPGQGVLVIEVKGWFLQNLIGGDHELITIKDRHGRVRCCAHPLRQARNYMNHLRDHCRQKLWAQHLLQKEGLYQNQFFFPFGYFAVLSNITRNQLVEAGRQWNTIFSPKEVLARDELEAVLGDQASAGLGRFFDPSWPFPAMTELQVKTLRAIIHPEVVISKPVMAARAGAPILTPQVSARVPERATAKEVERIGAASEQCLRLGPATTADAAAVVDEVAVEVVSPPTPVRVKTGLLDLKVLDLEQELAARKVGSGHRLVFGVAGAGKTIVLISRARLLAQVAGRRVLVLCFNVPLASYLEHTLEGESELITVRHFDKLAREYGVPRRTYPTTEPHAALGQRLLARLQAVPTELRYDAVLIDEAQDFDPSWFQCARHLLQDPDHGDLLIVGDGNQGIYGKRRTSWSSLGISARGRTTYLRKSYRSTREIIEFAAPFARTENREDDGVSPVAIDPTQAARSNGVQPILIQVKDRTEECGHAVDIISGLLRGRFGGRQLSHALQPADIGVLVPAVLGDLMEIFARFRQDLEAKAIPFIWVSNRKDQIARTRVCDPGVKVLNLFHAKGLQFKAVVFLWADILPQEGWLGRTREEQEMLFYVALTRTEDYLAVIHSGESEFVARLRARVPCAKNGK